MEFRAEHDPDPLDVEFLETQIRREASDATGLGDEVELAIFVPMPARWWQASAGGPGGTAVSYRASG